MSTLVLDDRDPAIIYVGQWLQGGNPDAEYDGTTTYCLATPNTTTSATLNFVGTGVEVRGTIQQQHPQFSLYSVDGDTPTNFTGPSVLTTEYSQQFFSVSGLSNDNHTLVVVPVTGKFILDLIVVQQPTAATSTTPIPSSSSDPTTSLPLPNSTTETPMQESPSSQHQATSDSQKRSNSIGEIVGGIIIGILALCLAFYFVRRRRANSMEVTSPESPRTLVIPYRISQSSPVEVAPRRSNSLYATSGIVEYGESMIGNPNNNALFNAINGRSMKRQWNQDSPVIGQEPRILPDTWRPTSPPPMYQTESGYDAAV